MGSHLSGRFWVLLSLPLWQVCTENAYGDLLPLVSKALGLGFIFLPSKAQRRLHPAPSLQSSRWGSSREGRSQVRPAAWSVFGDLGWILKCQHSSLEVEDDAVCVWDEVHTNGILRCRTSVSSRRHISKDFVA